MRWKHDICTLWNVGIRTLWNLYFVGIRTLWPLYFVGIRTLWGSCLIVLTSVTFVLTAVRFVLTAVRFLTAVRILTSLLSFFSAFVACCRFNFLVSPQCGSNCFSLISSLYSSSIFSFCMFYCLVVYVGGFAFLVVPYATVSEFLYISLVCRIYCVFSHSGSVACCRFIIFVSPQWVTNCMFSGVA